MITEKNSKENNTATVATARAAISSVGVVLLSFPSTRASRPALRLEANEPVTPVSHEYNMHHPSNTAQWMLLTTEYKNTLPLAHAATAKKKGTLQVYRVLLAIPSPRPTCDEHCLRSIHNSNNNNSVHATVAKYWISETVGHHCWKTKPFRRRHSGRRPTIIGEMGRGGEGGGQKQCNLIKKRPPNAKQRSTLCPRTQCSSVITITLA